MFKKKETISPEEKLLKIIEEPREKKSEKAPFAFNKKGFNKLKLSSQLKNINFLDFSNRFLLFGGVILTILLILTIFKPVQTQGLAVGPGEEIGFLQPITDEGLQSQMDSYVDSILKRNMFDVLQAVGAAAAAIKEELDLKLVGIIFLGKNQSQAIIEDKDTRTYLINEGDLVLGQIKVEKIESNRVILRRGEETIELK